MMPKGALTFQEQVDALDFSDCLIVGLGGITPSCVGVHADAQDLSNMIKNQYGIRDQIVENGDFEGVVRWFFYGRFDAVNKLVPDKAYRPTGEGRHARYFDRLVGVHLGFN